MRGTTMQADEFVTKHPHYAGLLKQADGHIATAAKHDITLTYKDFTVYEGELWIDSMDPKDWIEAMTMD